VLLVVANGGSGGMQVQVGLLAQGLAAAGCEVVVASGPGELDGGTALVRRLPALSARTVGGFASALHGIVDDVAPDVVHAHGLRLAPLVSGRLRHRSLVTCHGVDPDRVSWSARAVRATRVAVASCGEGPRRLLAAHGIRSRVLNNAVPELPAPVDRRAFAARFGLDEATLLAISPARLTKQKDPITLVRALRHARGVSCVLIGGGPLEASVRAEVERLDVGARVVVQEWLDDARALLGGADVLALSSVWEGQPTVVLEAMAAGVAVVATASPGTADTVVDEVSGLLATPRDPVALATALERARDPDLRASLVAAGRAQAVDHRLDVVVDEHLAGYRRLLEGGWP
jgi:glycosyltransferase involved in cell wall biosynthesis